MVVVLGCCLLLFVGACWCLLVPVGACWCLLVPVGACWWCLLVVLVCVCVWWVCSGPPRDLPPPEGPSPGPPKISLFFFSPAGNFFLSSLCGFSRGILVVFLKTGTLKCARLGSRIVVWNPGGPTRPGRRGFTRQPENSKRAHLSAPALQTPPKFHEKTPRERTTNEISGGREQKKREILGSPPFVPPTLRALPLRAPPLRAPTKNKIGQMRSGQIRSTKIGQIRPNKDGQMRPVNFGQMWYWPSVVLAKCDQIRMAKTGLAKCGRDRHASPEDLSKVERREFRCVQVFRCSGVQVFRCSGVYVFSRRLGYRV